MSKSIQRGTADRAGHDPRAAALRVLDRVLNSQEPSQALLDTALRESKMVPSDKGLCTELVYGYLRHALRLSWNLEKLMQKPEKLPDEMRLTLGLAAYELAHLSRIPGYASVDWAVSRVRNRFGAGLSKVANGVLRTFQRDLKGYTDPARYALEDAQEGRALLHSLPLWVVRLWEAAYGEERALAYMKASSEESVPAVRINASREDAATIRNQLTIEGRGLAVASWGVAFPEGAPYLCKTLARKGRASFQSAGVQEAMTALDYTSWQAPLWDACAGRGGKSAALLEAGCPVHTMTDTAAARLQGVAPELARLGLEAGDLRILEADAANPPFTDRFATILADVPCSGLGTLSRRPEIRFRRTAEDVAALCVTQSAILDAAAGHILPGGRIIYLTCTLNPAENEDQAKAFLARHSDFRLEQEWNTAPDSPWREFFYAAVLRAPE